jgi:hypothetical protein
MATLRDPFYAPNTVSLDEMEQLQNSDKGSLRRGWESGRIGAERNALAIDEFAARAAGDEPRLLAETLPNGPWEVFGSDISTQVLANCSVPVMLIR